jgi:hypothetical protein
MPLISTKGKYGLAAICELKKRQDESADEWGDASAANTGDKKIDNTEPYVKSIPNQAGNNGLCIRSY